MAEGRKIVASLHFQFILFLLGEKSLRIISDYTKNLPRIPRTHMKSLHYWFLVSCVIKGVKSSLRFISNLFLSYWAKNRFAPFLTFFGLIGEYQVYQEYQEFTKNTRNTHEIASLFPIFSILTLCRLYLFSSMKINLSTVTLTRLRVTSFLWHRLISSFLCFTYFYLVLLGVKSFLLL